VFSHQHPIRKKELNFSTPIFREQFTELHTSKNEKRQKDAEQKNAPDWLTRPIFGCLSIIISRSIITVNPGPAGDLGRSPDGG